MTTETSHFDPPPETFDVLEDLEPWQAATTCLGLLVLIPALLGVPWWLASSITSPNSIARLILAGAMGTSGTIITLSLVARLLDVPVRAVFLRPPTLQTAGWTAVGIGLALLVVLATAALTDGVFRFDPGSPTAIVAGVAGGVAIGVWTGTVEELVFRGGMLSVLGHHWNWSGAVFVTAVLFGAIHNGHAASAPGTISYVALTSIAGLLLGLVTVTTANVWNAVAIHASWNAMFSPHIASLGTADGASPLIQYRPTGGSWIVLSEFWEPVGSPLAIAVFAIATCAYALVAFERTD